MIIKRVLDDNFGSIIISVILGLGLAAVFRRVCSGDSCVVIKAPNPTDINKYYYKIDNSCYKYTPNVVDCGSNGSSSSSNTVPQS